jgi:hypothetical protein
LKECSTTFFVPTFSREPFNVLDELPVDHLSFLHIAAAAQPRTIVVIIQGRQGTRRSLFR